MPAAPVSLPSRATIPATPIPATTIPTTTLGRVRSAGEEERQCRLGAVPPDRVADLPTMEPDIPAGGALSNGESVHALVTIHATTGDSPPACALAVRTTDDITERSVDLELPCPGNAPEQ